MNSTEAPAPAAPASPTARAAATAAVNSVHKYGSATKSWFTHHFMDNRVGSRSMLVFLSLFAIVAGSIGLAENNKRAKYARAAGKTGACAAPIVSVLMTVLIVCGCLGTSWVVFEGLTTQDVA
jgi:hypothetical protein